MRPGTREVWVGDVGWGEWEEIDRLVDPVDGDADNFGWPCYEGDGRQGAYDATDLDLCESLYTQGASAVVAPYFRYHHNDLVLPTDVCPKGGSSIAGLSFAFATGSSYPAEYRDALFFADYSRRCIWVIPTGADGLPDVAKRRTFVAGAAEPVDVQVGPGGDLFYVDLGGTIRRIRYDDVNEPPLAVATATPTAGPVPLTVSFDGHGSSDPDGDLLTFAWDLDGDGAFDDATGPTASFTYTSAGNYTAYLQVSDGQATAASEAPITAGNSPPIAAIDLPDATPGWRVGDTISFAGRASDDHDGDIGAAAFRWSLILHHCPSTCHEHPLQTFTGVAAGTFVAPDHEYPAHLELRFTATDSGGLTSTATTILHPATVALSFETAPPGLPIAVGSSSELTPFTRLVIAGSTISVAATGTQTSQGETYQWSNWSDGGAASHLVTADASRTLTATYTPDPTGPGITNLAIKTTPDRATITWTTSRPALHSLAYGTDRNTMTSTPFSRTLTTEHSIVLSNLSRRTTYQFDVINRDAADRVSTTSGAFRTK